MSINEELTRALVKFIVSIAISIVIAPLLLILGANFVLEVMGTSSIPYTLSSYFGALLLRIGVMIRVEDDGNNNS